MTNPVYKIEVWEPGGGSALHTITKDAINIRAKETLTGNVGTFSFSVPTKMGSNYKYNDIDPFDTVKIWFGYNSVSGNPDFVGKVYQISAPLSTPLGYRRIIKGRNQGEILQRRLHGMKEWDAVDASVIVTELANDLSLGTSEIETDTTDVTLTIEIDRYETYFNLLRAVSDYWYNAGTQIKKDFYVTWDNKLLWKSRPLRTAGVETFTVGDNIISYQVLRDIESVKNNIIVFGAKERASPSDHDSWTEDLTKPNNQLDHADGTWTVGGGGATISKDTDEAKGTYSVMTSGGTGTQLIFTLDAGKYANANRYPSVTFQVKPASGYPQFTMQLQDSSANRVNQLMQVNDGLWSLHTFPVGDKNTNQWQHLDASFDWANIKKLIFETDMSVGVDLRVDNLFFNHRNFVGLADDSTSQTNYGLREMMVIDESLHSMGDCSKRAETILYQRKDASIRIDLQVPGNTNLKIGDRLSMTIPAESISSVNFDVITVEPILFPPPIGFRTNAIMVNTPNIRARILPIVTMQELWVRTLSDQKEIGKGVLTVK